jgi:hypothetical protein
VLTISLEVAGHRVTAVGSADDAIAESRTGGSGIL